MKVLILTSEWPTTEHPEWVPFLVNEVEALRSAGITIDVFHFRGRQNPFAYLKAWFQLRRKYDLAKYDVIHAEWGQSAILALPKQRPLITTFRGSDLEGIVNRSGKYTFLGKILQIISRWIAAISDEVILVSEGMSKQIPKRNYYVLPVCLDQDLFRPMDREYARAVLNLPNDLFLVLFPANPERAEKRFALAELAFNYLTEKIPAKLVITKNVPHNMMPYYLNACDVLLITSSHEGSPTIIFESLACNLPIVSVDVGDVKSRIGGIRGCMVCEGESPEEISKALYAAYLFGSRIDGRESIKDMTMGNFVEKMLQIYTVNVQKQ